MIELSGNDSEVALQILPRQLDVAEDLGHQPTADRLASVNRHHSASAVWMLHEVMAAPRSDNLKPESLQGGNDLSARERRILRHADTRTR